MLPFSSNAATTARRAACSSGLSSSHFEAKKASGLLPICSAYSPHGDCRCRKSWLDNMLRTPVRGFDSRRLHQTPRQQDLRPASTPKTRGAWKALQEKRRHPAILATPHPYGRARSRGDDTPARGQGPLQLRPSDAQDDSSIPQGLPNFHVSARQLQKAPTGRRAGGRARVIRCWLNLTRKMGTIAASSITNLGGVQR